MTRKKLTTDSFIKDAIKVHGTKYDYSKVVYAGSKSKVIIVCPEHGSFDQLPYDHRRGYGCRKCAHKNTAIKKTYTTKIFIEKATDLYADSYDYSKVEYVRAHDKVIIICPKHGEFTCRPSDHLDGLECLICQKK